MAAKQEWKRVEDVKAFLAERGTRSVGVHHATNVKRLPWPVCARCGLLYLKNEATRRELKKPCIVEE